MIRFVRANGNMPHRCPLCHRIPDVIHLAGYARWLRTYSCSVCRVRWWRGYHDMF